MSGLRVHLRNNSVLGVLVQELYCSEASGDLDYDWVLFPSGWQSRFGRDLMALSAHVLENGLSPFSSFGCSQALGLKIRKSLHKNLRKECFFISSYLDPQSR